MRHARTITPATALALALAGTIGCHVELDEGLPGMEQQELISTDDSQWCENACGPATECWQPCWMWLDEGELAPLDAAYDPNTGRYLMDCGSYGYCWWAGGACYGDECGSSGDMTESCGPGCYSGQACPPTCSPGQTCSNLCGSTGQPLATVRLLTFNTMLLPFPADEDNSPRDADIGREVATHGYDIVALQETFSDAHRDKLVSESYRWGGWQSDYRGRPDSGGELYQDGGLTGLSRFRSVAHHEVVFDDNVMLTADCAAYKGFVHDRYEIPTAAGPVYLDVINTHLQSSLDYPYTRSRQLAQLRAWIDGNIPDGLIVIVGDLNIPAFTPWRGHTGAAGQYRAISDQLGRGITDLVKHHERYLTTDEAYKNLTYVTSGGSDYASGNENYRYDYVLTDSSRQAEYAMVSRPNRVEINKMRQYHEYCNISGGLCSSFCRAIEGCYPRHFLSDHFGVEATLEIYRKPGRGAPQAPAGCGDGVCAAGEQATSYEANYASWCTKDCGRTGSYYVDGAWRPRAYCGDGRCDRYTSGPTGNLDWQYAEETHASCPRDCAPVNHALGKPCQQHSTYSWYYDCSRAVDGNVWSRWASNRWAGCPSETAPHWMTVDLGAVRHITRARLLLNQNGYPGAASLYFSRTSASGPWQLAASHPASGTGVWNETEVGVSARYWKVAVTWTADNCQANVWELQLLGDSE